MAEYVPIYTPGKAITMAASATITAGQLVYVSGAGTVAPTSGVSAAWLGVAATDAANGDSLTVHSGGVQQLVAGTGGVTAGDLVTSATGGGVVKLAAVSDPTAADVTNTRAIVGIALNTATATNPVQIKMER